jgi:hypothetical protein
MNRRSTDRLAGRVSAFWDFVDNRGVIRRLVLLAAIVMTWRVSLWAMEFAGLCKLSGVEAAALIAAVTAPVTLFASSVFKNYIEARQ